MTMPEIKRIIEQQVSKRGYYLEERPSNTTGSWYFKIYASPEVSLLFRVSDHKTQKDVITLRIDRQPKYNDVVSFVNNRCKDLGYRHTKAVLGM